MESGVILADSVEFTQNEFERGEQELWNGSVIRFESAGLSEKLGEFTVSEIGKFKLVPNESVQDYVSKVGESLIPKYALSSSGLGPSNFLFRFYVVVNNQPNAFALPTGVFIIHSGMFAVLENEAQLAALIARELAHVTQEHQWREMQERKNETSSTPAQTVESFTEAAIRGGYTPAHENQADRLSLEYMVNAGYDPREAAKLWTAIANTVKTKNYFYSSDNQITRRSYLLSQIKENYSDVRLQDFRIEETQFKRISDAVKEAASRKTPSVE
jgi:predicted Zn-dependent protease